MKKLTLNFPKFRRKDNNKFGLAGFLKGLRFFYKFISYISIKKIIPEIFLSFILIGFLTIAPIADFLVIYFFSSTLITWAIFSHVKKIYQKVFTIIFLIFSLAILYFMVKIDKLLYILPIISLIEFIGLIIIFQTKKIAKPASKNLRKIIYYGLVASNIVLIIFICQQIISLNNQSKKLNQKLLNISNNLPKIQKQIDQKAQKLSKDQFIKQFILDNNPSDLSSYTQNLMVRNKLTYLVITDQIGNVLVRANMPNKIGDSFFNEIPAAKEVFQSGSFMSFEKTGKNNINMISGRVIKNDQQESIGAVFAGDYFGDTLAKKLAPTGQNLAIAATSGIVGKYSTDNQVNKVFQFTDLLSHLQLSETKTKLFVYSDQIYLAGQTLLENSQGQSIAKIILLEKIGKKSFSINQKMTALKPARSTANVKFLEPITVRYLSNYLHPEGELHYQLMLRPNQQLKNINLKLTYTSSLLVYINQDSKNSICSGIPTISQGAGTISINCQIGPIKSPIISDLIFKAKSNGIANLAINPSESYLILSDGHKTSLDGFSLTNNYIITP